MSDFFEKLPMDGVKHIIVVASGKGGVGKSTVAANLAVAMAREGLNTALFDADIFGPSIPRMFGIEDVKPDVSALGEKEIFFPVKKYGVSIMSIGFFIDRDQSLIWRGPMAAKAVTQLLGDTQWGDIDYMIIDFPPGTSDIQLTTVQKLELAGSIIVTTPQEISLNDARKAGSMFLNPDLKVPILGVIENMSWFSPVKHPDEVYYVFGKGGGSKLAGELKTSLLGQIPLVLEIGESAEKGLTVFSQENNLVIKAFEKIAEAIISNKDIKTDQNKNLLQI
ncbi:MAG TPA: Mrp/NBP35 family ATP-binding protein [Bacteroidales bacterium]|nr:Mrp/NBP35 family ATP-binding protein [Bacteroidales bacterium]